MKMAKASEADIDMAMEVSNVLNDIERGFFPTKLQSDEDAESEEIEWIDTDDQQQYKRLIFGLKHLLNKGSISRVIWGMAVVCDPANECIDPDADCIEHHPKRQQMESALLWTLWHHQGGSSHIGQPIRKLLGIGQHDRMTDEQIEIAKAFGRPEKYTETEAVPAIVFYPAGSLGEEVAL
jgi:hypothetical protein